MLSNGSQADDDELVALGAIVAGVDVEPPMDWACTEDAPPAITSKPRLSVSTAMPRRIIDRIDPFLRWRPAYGANSSRREDEGTLSLPRRRSGRRHQPDAGVETHRLGAARQTRRRNAKRTGDGLNAAAQPARARPPAARAHLRPATKRLSLSGTAREELRDSDGARHPHRRSGRDVRRTERGKGYGQQREKQKHREPRPDRPFAGQ
jgi:hypothetical protein